MINRFAFTVRLIMGCLLLIWVGGTVAALSHHSSQASAVHTIQQNSAHQRAFWSVVGGVATPTGVRDDQVLAADLRTALNKGTVSSFAGDPNAYAGVDKLLGVNPFTGVGCPVCGPLTPSFVANLTLIQHGQLNQVLANLPHPTTPHFGWMRAFLILAMLYLVGGAIAGYIGVAVTGFSPTSHDFTVDVAILAPCLFLVLRFGEARKEHSLEGAMWKQFPEAMTRIQEVDRTLGLARSSAERAQVRSQRDTLYTEIRTATLDRTNHTSDDDLKFQLNGLNKSLETLRLQQEALAELRGGGEEGGLR